MGILDRFRLDGRTAVVTGGNRGIGRAIAQAAPLVVYLASEASCYVTGSSVLIDGGYTVR